MAQLKWSKIEFAGFADYSNNFRKALIHERDILSEIRGMGQNIWQFTVCADLPVSAVCGFFMDTSFIRKFFCITSAIIGIPFFGGYLVVSLPKALKSDTQLITYDQNSISDGTRTVAWTEITSISYSGPSIREWLLPKFPVLIFHLKNRETWTVNTYYLLTDTEIQSVMKLLRGWSVVTERKRNRSDRIRQKEHRIGVLFRFPYRLTKHLPNQPSDVLS